MLLRPFDPWTSPLCTCPPKLSLNPYTGCFHGCLYCYASSYVPRFADCRPKAHLLERLGREVRRLSEDHLVALSLSSDPYPPLEARLCLTRGCLRLLSDADLRIQVVTKSDLVRRDIDILRGARSSVSLTVTTLKDDLALRLEPGAPPPTRRIEAMEALSDAGIPVIARIDPIIPGINVDEIEDLVEAVANAGASHVVSSTYKARGDNLLRISSAFPSVMEAISPLFIERVGGSRYLPEKMRHAILKRVASVCRSRGITFSACREGVHSPVACDGSHLISTRSLHG